MPLSQLIAFVLAAKLENVPFSIVAEDAPARAIMNKPFIVSVPVVPVTVTVKIKIFFIIIIRFGLNPALLTHHIRSYRDSETKGNARTQKRKHRVEREEKAQRIKTNSKQNLKE